MRRFKVLMIIASLEKATKQLHKSADIEIFVGGCFRAHQISDKEEKTSGLYIEF